MKEESLPLVESSIGLLLSPGFGFLIFRTQTQDHQGSTLVATEHYFKFFHNHVNQGPKNFLEPKSQLLDYNLHVLKT